MFDCKVEVSLNPMSHLYQSSVFWISLLVDQSLNLIQKSDTGVLQL